ncbi:MAG: ADP-ribosylglycohydrolase family protein [Thermodesulfobacteriota bacterium]
MLGAIAGDIIGSVYESAPIKTIDFPLFREDCFFTDDTVLTVAVADCLLSRANYPDKFKEYFRLYPFAGYGSAFYTWASSASREPYGSWGNGSAMRVSPIGMALDSLDEVLKEAERSASVTHNHPEGIKGAQATAAAIFLARSGASKEDIRRFVTTTFGYDLSEPLDSIRPRYRFDISCQGTVPPAITAFLESEDYEDAIRKAISLGGDSDTLACITGGIAEAFYGGVPQHIATRVREILDDRLNGVVTEFYGRYRLNL